MKLREFPLLTDQNIHGDVVTFLRYEGFDVADVAQMGLIGATDDVILTHALAEGRVVVTHDGDFGTLTIPQGSSFVGIVYLRPGHTGAQPTIDSLRQLLAVDVDVQPPFIVVVKRTGNTVSIRVRQVTP